MTIEAQAGYHRHLYEAMWLPEVARDAAAGVAVAGLDQMGHFGTAGCDLVADAVLARLGKGPIALLELGCGFGGALRYLLGRLDGDPAIGVDIVLDHCRVMRTIGGPAVPVCGSASALGLRAGAVDAVVASGSFSHFADPAAVLAEVARALRPGGVLSFVEEVSLLAAPPTARFRELHPTGVFTEARWAEREKQLAACGFTDVVRVDLSGWARELLTKRLLAMRLYRGQIVACYGAAQTDEIVATLTATRDEIAAGILTPAHVTATRPR
jgi:SAM-dependent methyltransferase